MTKKNLFFFKILLSIPSLCLSWIESECWKLSWVHKRNLILYNKVLRLCFHFFLLLLFTLFFYVKAYKQIILKFKFVFVVFFLNICDTCLIWLFGEAGDLGAKVIIILMAFWCAIMGYIACYHDDNIYCNVWKYMYIYYLRGNTSI